MSDILQEQLPLVETKDIIGASDLDLKPPLKWAGGKRWLVPILQPIWDQHSNRRLVEPFCGGLAVALGLLPANALLNDINAHLINFYLWLQKGLEIDLVMKNDEAYFYSRRDRFNELMHQDRSTEKEAAEIFYYMNRTGYNGLCRFNRSGEFNVPFGKYKKINYVDDFTDYRAVLANWHFQHSPFMDIRLRKDDFIYADPPYDVDFRQYSKNGFSWDDQVALAEWLSQHEGPVVLSNQATERIVDLYLSLDFELMFLSGPRRISSNGDRTPAKEVLAIRGV